MGWFWADPCSQVGVPVPPQPVSKASASPPAGCPMRKADSLSTTIQARRNDASPTASSCPVGSSKRPLRPPTTPDESKQSSPHASSSSTLSKLNPLNYMPILSNSREYASQSGSLPLDREPSSIPRGDSDSNWEYPSPQQMYNAMLRKGYTDTPVDAVESMVAIHNFLNEGAWNEIVEWEAIFNKGLRHGWQICSRGEDGVASERLKRERLRQRREDLSIDTQNDSDVDGPRLLRFMGRPGETTPKARILQALGYAFPERYNSELPFDRHDWYVSRQTPTGTKEVRYIIDYYAAGTQETGEPVFYLDIRPALDTPTAAVERAMRWGGDLWHRASGGAAREKGKEK